MPSGAHLRANPGTSPEPSVQLGVITNPKSRKNRRRPGHAARLRGLVGDMGEVHETPSIEAIKPVLRDFLRRDVSVWVSDGGDGALHWMLRAGLELLEEPEFIGRELPVAVPTKAGTIDFVAGNVGIRGDTGSILEALRRSLEKGESVDSVEVDTMLIEGEQRTPAGVVHFRTYGFASAIAGIGQRFFDKYYESDDPSPTEIVKIVGRVVASWPVASTSLKYIPGMPEVLRSYATEVFKPMRARMIVDGREFENQDVTCAHLASMSIDLGGVMRFFHSADVPGQLHAIVGAPPPASIIGQLPRMYMGKPITSKDTYDGPARDLVLEAIGDELLAPIIDGEPYADVERVRFRLGPKVKIARVVAG